MHGTSGKDVGDGSIGVLADAVVAVLDAVGAGQAHLVSRLIEGAGHMVHMEKPAGVQAAVEETVARAG